MNPIYTDSRTLSVHVLNKELMYLSANLKDEKSRISSPNSTENGSNSTSVRDPIFVAHGESWHVAYALINAWASWTPRDSPDCTQGLQLNAINNPNPGSSLHSCGIDKEKRQKTFYANSACSRKYWSWLLYPDLLVGTSQRQMLRFL